MNSIKETYTEVFIRGLIDLIMISTLIVMMFVYGKWLILVVCGFSFLYAVLRIATYDYYQSLESNKITTNAQNNSHIMETLYSLLTIKSLGIERIRKNRWMNLQINNNNANIRADKFNMLFLEINALTVSIEQVIVLFLSGSMVIEHEMTIGMFIAFNSYRGVFSDRFSNLVNVFLQFKILSLHGERVSEIAFQKKEEITEDINDNYEVIPRTIEVKNINHTYDSYNYVLENISFKMDHGENIVIIGSSGAGKSTLMKIMAGLIRPTKGDILINGISIYKIGLNNYRNMIACVLQEDKLLSGSIVENITCFNTNYDIGFAIDCAKKCNIHNFIKDLPRGYFTNISELGNSLSGGQKQRLMIARALYKKPKILFLDEATSHLDDENENIINLSIGNMQITRIMIAHRQSTIQFADRVFRI
ncbi:peptidase domain-containing ABC transporter [Photorhabdus sp. RM323S]|uniref:peptidase domain-containing ABC transporter n=1 Tax=Photorhabdus sp. RM323S TaxID=3342828 RepID=UPI0036D90200